MMMMYSKLYYHVAIINFAVLFFGTVSCSTDNNHNDHIRELVQATECVQHGASNTQRCRFNSRALQLDTSDIEFVAHNGMKVKCAKEHHLDNTDVWHGECDGNARDANFVQRTDDNGDTIVFGSVHIDQDICHIAPNAHGVDEMSCTPIIDFPDEEESLVVPPHEENDYEYNANSNDDRTKRNLVGELEFDSLLDNMHRDLQDNTTVVIDVMVVWTKQAECKVSGLQLDVSNNCILTTITENNMFGLIDLAIAETNTALQLSGMYSSLRLVHAYRDPDYVEPTSNVYPIALEHLRNATDGKLDSVHSKRLLYRADLVSMFMSSSSSCGIGYVNTGKAYAFSVIQSACATGVYSFGHEIGHNFNMNHDRGTAGMCTITGTASNYGYRTPDAAYRSILASNCRTNVCGTMQKQDCTRVQRYSNTYSTYLDQAMGDVYNDNAKQWNSIRRIVASHNIAINCKSDAACRDNDNTTIDICNTAKGTCIFTPYVPTNAPTKNPTNAPTRNPTNAPTHLPSSLPSSNPSSVPSSAPNTSPSFFPSGRPSSEPNSTPSLVPTDVPNTLPSLKPSTVPLSQPSRVPSQTPIKIDHDQKISTSPESSAMKPISYIEAQKVDDVNSAVWTIVTLQRVYVSPIPVCSVKYDTGISLIPAVVRMQNVTQKSFQIRLQNPSKLEVTSREVHCVIAEEGAYILNDGRQMEAKKFRSFITDHDQSWFGQGQYFMNNYTKPVVLGQVMTYTDSRWSVFNARASKNYYTAPYKKRSFRAGKHVGEDTPVSRRPETVGYIVIESGHATYDGVEMESGRTKNVVVGYVEEKITQSFATPFNATPLVTIVSQVGMNDREGSWAVLTGNTTSSYFGVAVDEDQTFDKERMHGAEEVDYIVFATAGSIQTFKA